jgi:hypothetical protein
MSDANFTEKTFKARRVEDGPLAVPEWLADMADSRALEIFAEHMRFNRPLQQILGEIYLTGVRAGIAAARDRHG